MVSADRLGRGDAAHALHAYVHQHDIGPFALALEQRLLAILGLGDDDQARHAADHLRQACTHHHVIVDQQDAHRLGQFARRLRPGLALGAVRRIRLLLLFHHSDARSNRLHLRAATLSGRCPPDRFARNLALLLRPQACTIVQAA
jgi:hypothetical protein